MLRLISRFFAALLLCGAVFAQTVPRQNAALGFSVESFGRQQRLEQQFDSTLKAANLRDWMRRLSARPHAVGQPYGKENAEFMLALFKAWGFDAQIERFDVLFPTPKTRLLEMTAPERFTAKLQEPPLKEDSTSDQQTEQLPTYNAFSIDGDVSGKLVYVNYGVPRDYEELERRGVDVKGKIVIARYGNSWRGIKPKVAAERGAIGCLIYSDPKDDGFAQGDVYPRGAWKNENGVQRGSVLDMPTYPGDPTTPGAGSTPGVKRLDYKQTETITKIPVLPISYGDALPLLKNIGGATAPESWRGALPVTYKLGGAANSATVRLKLEFNWDIKPAYNVIAKMRGAEQPDQWIIRGNHHDAWVNGADDPISGIVALLEEARAVGELARANFKPKRTIVYAAWDAEEPGLLGSTEWVETHQAELRQKAVAYINTDSNGRGFLGVGGSHTLEKFVNQIARDVPDPQTRMSVWERERASRLVDGTANEKRDARTRADLRISALGSGSDYTPFLQHLGIASLNIGFGGENGGGEYHSIYDSFDFYQRFGDPDFAYGIALAKVCGRATLRLANADVLPFEFTNSADTIAQYISEIVKMTDQMREETTMMNQMIADGTLIAAQDPQEKFVLPQPKPAVPNINFAVLHNALRRLQQTAKDYETATNGKQVSAATAPRLDRILLNTERALTNPSGLPRRAWFRHQIYAPGFYTGYGVKTLPSVREAVEERNFAEANQQIRVAAETIERFAAEIERATKTIEAAP